MGISWNVNSNQQQRQGHQESERKKSSWKYDDMDLCKIWFDGEQKNGVGIKYTKMFNENTGETRHMLKFQTQWNGADKRASKNHPDIIPIWYTIPFEFVGDLSQALAQISARNAPATSAPPANRGNGGRNGNEPPPDIMPF